jgi:hypothetical protein
LNSQLKHSSYCLSNIIFCFQMKQLTFVYEQRKFSCCSAMCLRNRDVHAVVTIRLPSGLLAVLNETFPTFTQFRLENVWILVIASKRQQSSASKFLNTPHSWSYSHNIQSHITSVTERALLNILKINSYIFTAGSWFVKNDDLIPHSEEMQSRRRLYAWADKL